MSGLSLRAKLMAMNGHGAVKKAAEAPARMPMTVHVADGPVPSSLYTKPDARTLKRMGVDFLWPGIDRLLFLDTETTGLSGGAGTLAFMIGLGYVENDRFVTEQYLIGDYPDELDMLIKVAERVRAFDGLVTFNGRTFDVPLIQNRLTMMRLDALPELAHIDLLLPARRLWKKRLGSVRLSVLEEKVLRCGRVDDLPGSEAPRRFFDYLKTGDRALLTPVLEHNRQDVCSMAALLASLIENYAAPHEVEEPADLLSLAKVLERQDERDEALRCYHLAGRLRPMTTIAALRGERASCEALFALGLLYKRMGDSTRAARAFETAAQRGRLGTLPMIELAKLCEHRTRDYAQALNWTLKACAMERDEDKLAALKHRRARIERKILRYGGQNHGI